MVGSGIQFGGGFNQAIGSNHLAFVALELRNCKVQVPESDWNYTTRRISRYTFRSSQFQPFFFGETKQNYRKIPFHRFTAVWFPKRSPLDSISGFFIERFHPTALSVANDQFR